MSTFTDNFTNFELDPGAYVAFDAASLRDLINNRLTEQGVFTDHLFKGSNLSTQVDIIAYAFHVLMFYLNRTSNEGMFSETQIFENINRIVKAIAYKPVGPQTSILTFNAKATGNLAKNLYTIPRYSYVNVGTKRFTFLKDATFSKTIAGEEDITSLGNENVLYQGEILEFPTQVATGDPSEFVTLAVDKGTLVEGSSVNVYVRRIQTGSYVEFKEVDSLFLYGPTDAVFEKRYNESGYYEIKFGDAFAGMKLDAGDEIFMFYLKSDGDEGVIEAGSLNANPVFLYKTPIFNSILEDVTPEGITYMGFEDIEKISLSSSLASTAPSEGETVEDIRENAPQFFKGQNRLISKADFQSKIKTNFGNILQDVAVLDNDTYIEEYMEYFTTLDQIVYPSLESRILLNHTIFSNPTNFNNVHIIGVPRIENRTSANIQSNFLVPSQKQLIKNEVAKNKVIGTEVVFSDPVFTAFDICAAESNEVLSSDFTINSRLVIVPEDGLLLDKQSIVQSVSNILLNYFKNSNCKLNQLIDFTAISNDIAAIRGVERFYTTRTDSDVKLEGLNLLMWNPVYESSDINIINQTTRLPIYKFPYWYDIQNIGDKITVE
jgi:hypothetical protein